MHALAPLLVLLAAVSGAPLASNEPGEQRGANPVTLDDLPLRSLKRLRVGLGVSWTHLELSAPGGNAFGLGASAAYALRYGEAALSLYGQGGFEAQDAHARHSGPATSYLRATLRLAPFSGWLRVMLEAGAQVGYERAWSWCAQSPSGDQCGVVGARASYAGVAGIVVVARASRLHLTLGLDGLLKGPSSPEMCGLAGCGSPAIGEGRYGLQGWLEAGFGGVAW